MAILIVNAVLAWTVPKLAGNWNLDEGMLVVAAMTPIGAGLHEPVFTCRPFVMGRLGTVKQKLMKLLVEVREAT